MQNFSSDDYYLTTGKPWFSSFLARVLKLSINNCIWQVKNKGKEQVMIMEENFKNLKEEDYGSILISGEIVHVGSHRNICQPPVKGNGL